jgi:hydroxyethylthiazole kinase-like uncharacterized protein yjeF
MKILSPEQIKQVETDTINIQQIDLIDLMERSATAVLNWLKDRLDIKQFHFTIICGIGNNGGDGLALARLITESGGNVKVYLQKNNTYSLDNLSNQKRLKDAKIPFELFDTKTKLELNINTIIIDAIFGYGLNRPIDKEWKKVINQINESDNSVVSIDVPSGLFCNQINGKNDVVVQSEVTLTFQTPKLALFIKENKKYVKEVEILDISLDLESIEKQPSEFNFVSQDYLPYFAFERNKFSHKYEFGHTLLIGGSYGKIGAAVLAAKSVLKSGGGLVTAYLPKCGYEIMQTSFPEAMVMTDFSEDKITAFPDAGKFDTIAIGPGLGTDEKTLNAFEQFLNEKDLADKKMVIDADGINLLSKKNELLKKLPENSILTPHDGELERLIGKWKDSFEKFEKTQNFAKKHKLILISKGANTQTYLPNGEIYFNATGNPGMATAGSGDVLTGIIAGQLSKGFNTADAAIFGVYLHGFSGDEVAAQIGEESLMAGDIINAIPLAFKKMFG